MKLTDLDMEILNCILHSKEPISGRSIAYFCNASVNTIRKEVALINEVLVHQGCYIDAQASVGYSFCVQDPVKGRALIERLEQRYRRSRFMNLSTMERTYYIVRKLLTGGYVNKNSLCEELYCSESTLARELKQARAYLERYGLELCVQRGHGLYIKQDEWRIRLCILEQRNIFSRLSPAEQRKEHRFAAQNLVGQKERRVLINLMTEVFARSGFYRAHHLGMVYMAGFLILSRTRRCYTKNLRFTQEQIRCAEENPAWGLAQEVYAALPQAYREGVDKAEMLGFTMFLMSVQTISSEEEIPAAYREICQEDVREFLDECEIRYMEQHNYSREFCSELAALLYHFKLCVLFGVELNEGEHLDVLRQYGSSSTEYCRDLKIFYRRKYGVDLSEGLVLSAFYLFHGRDTDNRRPSLKLLVVSLFGIERARSIGRRLRRDYANYDISFQTAELCQLSYLPLAKFDLLVLDADPTNYQLPQTLPVILVQDVLRKVEIPEINAYFHSRMQRACEALMQPERFQQGAFHSKAEVFHCLAEMLPREKDPAALERELAENDSLMNWERCNKIVFAGRLGPAPGRTEIAVLINQTPFVWNEDMPRLILYTARGRADPQGQAVLLHIRKVLLHLEPNRMAQLMDEGYEGLLRVL